MRSHFWRGFPLALSLLVLAAVPCHAQVEVFNAAVDKYQAATSQWVTAFYDRANWLFWSLALIELTIIGFYLALRQADIQEIVGDLVRFILATGFFFALLQNGTTWMPAIVESFREAANAANVAAGGTPNINPSRIMDIGLTVAAKVCESGAWWNPGSKVFVGLMGIGILITAAMIAMTLIVAIVEMYIVTTCGVFVLGFGGSRWTREYAVKMITYAVSVGAKLMVLQLIIGLGEIFLADFASTFTTATETFNLGDVTPILVTLIVLLGLVRSIPNIAQSLIAGVNMHTGGGFGAMMASGAQAFAVAKMATAAATGGTGAVVAAAKLASAQGAAAATTGAGTAGTAGLTGAAGAAGGPAMGLGSAIMKGLNFAGRTAGNLAKAGAQDVKAGMTGDRKIATNMAQRMASSMTKETRDTRARNADDSQS